MFGAVQDWRGAASMEWEGEDKEGDWLLADSEKTTTEGKPSLLGVGRKVIPVRETQRVLVLEEGCEALAGGRGGGVQVDLTARPGKPETEAPEPSQG